MITMGSSYFVWINANEIISSWYLLGAVCVAPPRWLLQAIEEEAVMLVAGGAATIQVRETPSWPRSWANFSLLWLSAHRNARASLHLLGQPNAPLAPGCRARQAVPCGAAGGRDRTVSGAARGSLFWMVWQWLSTGGQGVTQL
jgi:hypothetical protein